MIQSVLLFFSPGENPIDPAATPEVSTAASVHPAVTRTLRKHHFHRWMERSKFALSIVGNAVGLAFLMTGGFLLLRIMEVTIN